jgi:hypothetical protein
VGYANSVVDDGYNAFGALIDDKDGDYVDFLDCSSHYFDQYIDFDNSLVMFYHLGANLVNNSVLLDLLECYIHVNHYES